MTRAQAGEGTARSPTAEQGTTVCVCATWKSVWPQEEGRSPMPEEQGLEATQRGAESSLSITERPRMI